MANKLMTVGAMFFVVVVLGLFFFAKDLAPLSLRAWAAVFHVPSWDITNTFRLEGGDFLVKESTQERGIRGTDIDRYIIVKENSGEITGTYLSDSDVRFVGQVGQVLWFDEYLKNLHARRASDLSVAVHKEQLGEGLPPGKWLKYRFDQDARQLQLLGTDGRYYAIDEQGRATAVKETPKAAEPQESRPLLEIERAPLPIHTLDITLTDEGDDRFTLHTVSGYSKTYLKAVISFRMENPESALLVYSDRLGPTGSRWIARIDISGAELWAKPLSTLIGKRTFPTGTVVIKGVHHRNDEVVLFLQENGEDPLHKGHICKLNLKTGQVLLSKPLKDY